MAAEVMASGGAQGTMFDAMPSVGRKFLLAGRGGLNLTHSEPLERSSPATVRGRRGVRGVERFRPTTCGHGRKSLGRDVRR